MRGLAADAGHCPAVARDSHLRSSQAGGCPYALYTKSNPGVPLLVLIVANPRQHSGLVYEPHNNAHDVLIVV